MTQNEVDVVNEIENGLYSKFNWVFKDSNKYLAMIKIVENAIDKYSKEIRKKIIDEVRNEAKKSKNEECVKKRGERMRVKKFYKRFVNGEQYLLFENGNIIEQEKQFYWEERKVYNRILPAIEMLKAKYGNLVTDDLLYKENGFVSRMVPVQRAYNALMNRQMEMINRIGANTLTVEDGSVDVDALSEEGLAPGKILVYRQGAEQPKMPFRITQEEIELLENERIFLLDEFYQHILAFESHLQVLKDKE